MHGCGGSVSGYVSVYCLGHRQRKYRICVDSFSTSHWRCALSSIFSSFTKSDNDAAAWSTRGHRGGGEAWASSYASHRNCSAATAVKSGLGETREGSLRGGGVILATSHCTAGGSCSQAIFSALPVLCRVDRNSMFASESASNVCNHGAAKNADEPELVQCVYCEQDEGDCEWVVRSRWRSRVPSA
jgi:hypothetical protein